MTMKELAERCEQATGPDRELDMLIDCALKGVIPIYPTEGHPMTPGRGGRIEAAGTFELLGWIDPGEVQRNFSPYGGEDRYPRYTASLDAAMSLVPEGRGLIYKRHGIKNVWRVQIHSGDETTFIEGDAATPALALCAAALKARASQETTR
jgi:hypothetical protein